MQIIAGYFATMNVIAFIVYGMDKRKAVKGEWRVSERTLLLLAVLGGSLGALTGMLTFHHKTQKVKFKIGVPLILVIQSVAIGAYLMR